MYSVYIIVKGCNVKDKGQHRSGTKLSESFQLR